MMLKHPVNSCTPAGFCVWWSCCDFFVVRSARLSIRGHGWLTLHTLVCLCAMWLSEFADRIRVDGADDWCLSCVVPTARNEEGSLLKKYYRFAFACSSSQTLLKWKEVNRDIFQGFQGVSLSPTSKLLNIQQCCAITNPQFTVTVQSIHIYFSWQVIF